MIGPGGFTGALGVVRAQIAPDCYVATVPLPAKAAGEYCADFATALERAGDTAKLIPFDTGTGLDCWIRARDVITVDVVSTEDPSS